jgi:DNA recombination protein RmuC
MWQSEYQNRNAQDIAGRAAALYDKFVTFAETLCEVKKSIGNAAEKCDGAIRLLTEGRGNIVKRIEDFRSLGVKPKKTLPSSMAEAPAPDEDENANTDKQADDWLIPDKPA